MPEKTPPFRLYVQILIFSGLVVLGVLILWPLQRAVQGGMVSIRDDIITRLEQRIDRKIRYTSISPSIFGAFDVRNVRVTDYDGRPVLSMSHFRVSYSLWELLWGKSRAIHSVRIDSPLIDFNTVRDKDLIDLLKNFKKGDDNSRQNFGDIFPDDLMVRIRNGKCLIRKNGDRFDLDELNLDVEIEGNRVIFGGKWRFGVTIDRLIGDPVNLYAAVRANGSFKTDMTEGEAVCSVPSITGDAVSASPVAFGLVLEDHVIRMGKMPDQLPCELSLEYGLNDKTIDAQFDCENFSLGEFLSFSGGLEDARQLLDIATSGAASLGRGQDGSLDYAVKLTGAALAASPAAGGSFEISASGDEQRVRVDTLRFSMPGAKGADDFFCGEISFSGGAGLKPFAPDGNLSLVDFGLSGREKLNADITIATHDGEIKVWSPTLNMGQMELSAFTALLRPSDDNLGFTVSALRPDGRKGSLLLKGSLNSKQRYMELDLKLNKFSAGDLAGMAMPFVQDAPLLSPLKGMLAGAEITTEIFLNTDFVHCSYNAPRFAFNSESDKGFHGYISLAGTERRFELNESRFIRGEDTLSLSGSADFADGKNSSFLMNARYRDIGYSFEGAVVNGKSVNIQGSHGLKVNLASPGGKSYAGSIHAEKLPVPFLGNPAFLSCVARLRYDSAASWFMNLEQFELTDIASPAGLAQMRISGSADPKGAHFPLLYYRDVIGPLNGKADISWPADYSGFTGTLEMGGGAEDYNVKASFADHSFKLAFAGSSVQLDRAFDKAKARADVDVYLSWDSINAFRSEINLYSVKGKLFGQEFGAKAYAVLDNGELTVDDLNFSFADIQGAIPLFTVNGARGEAEAKFEIIGSAGKKPIEGGLSFTANFRPLRSWFEIGRIVDSFAGNIHVEKLSYGSAGQAQTFDVAFSRADGVLSVTGGPRDMLRFRMDEEGSFYAGLSSPFPVRGTITGSIQQKNINARCNDLYIDMGELFNILPENDEFYMTGGYVNASLDIKGSITDPEFYGSARGTSLRIRVPNYISQEIRPIPLNVTIDGNEINFGPVSVASGKERER
jgi:hypothetical protein